VILTPVKNAVAHLDRYFELLERLTYPHELLSLGMLESDSSDDTLLVRGCTKAGARDKKQEEAVQTERNGGQVWAACGFHGGKWQARASNQ
jgi:hypothetical protein